MTKIKTDDLSNAQFPVVGIGASAGGLDAVKTFLQALPAKSGMAFVFVQHLSPNHHSILPDILQKVTPFPVHTITDNIHLKPDNLYIIPQNKIVTTTDGILKLAPREGQDKKVNTIDLFFTSLGVVHQSYAVGIVLSGALNDGTMGLQVIKSYGGLTFAQDEDSAAFDSMPASAAKSGAVDFVLPPAMIAQKLIAINSPFKSDYSQTDITDTIPQQDSEIFKQILTVLRVRRGVDFTYYKQSTLKRRIIRRMALGKIEKPAEYINFLRENKTEQDLLYNDMLISVTNFFRDPSSFDILCTRIFPALLNSKAATDSLRIWIAGCATGEEAYSMAICLQELLGDKTAAIKIQIFATDISETAITKARTGIYRPSEMAGISPSRQQQFFNKLDGNYYVSKAIRDMCVFAHHNLLKDPPFSKIDLVSCRNVMIYLEPVLQKRALNTFHYSLNKDGFLMLGKSETIGSNTDIFTTYGSSSEKIFIRKGAMGRFMAVSSPGREQSFREIDKSAQKENNSTDIFKIADDTMLANFMPSGVLVNDKFDIVQFRGTTETWLVPPLGKPSFNVLKMARPDLVFELRNLLNHAKKTNLAACKFNVFFKIGDLQHFVNLQVAPLPDVDGQYFLIVFQMASTLGIQPGMFDMGDNDPNTNYNASEMRIEHLERELMQTRADMRVIADEQESANEDLQSANEELLSGSEELQSLNEELETSKEELLSTNEEIMIVNKELSNRNEQLNNARLYSEGIVTTIRDPLLILDKEMRVKRATGGFYKKFKITEKETEGQLIYDLGNKQWDIPQLREMLEDVLPDKKELLSYEVTHTFLSIGTKTMCLNAREIDNLNGEKLILLSIEDITDKRKVEEGLAEAERLLSESKERLKFAVDSAGLGTWDYDPKNHELVWDKRCREIFELSHMRQVDISIFFEMVHPDDMERVEQSVKYTLYESETGDFDIEYRTPPVNEKIKWLKAKGRAYFDDDHKPIRFIGTLLDITVQKLTDEATIELLKKKDEFLSIASHELKTPITSLKAALQMIERTTAKNDEMKAAHLFVLKGIRQVNKLVELINDLLDVTKIQAGKLELNKTRFIVCELIEECCSEQDVLSAHKLEVECADDIEVYADKNRLEQVIVNLISNAIKYSPTDGKIIIRVSKIQDGIKVAVTDFGIGIPKKNQEFLFDRFYRVDETSQKYTGLGLGLYISAEIIRRHNGHIHIDSIPGKGSTFWFSMPL